ncbi:syntaxin-1A-like [Achroia grisella]|uniref:syntaxin-1A-like n=1 Tax=Achroia grisella TaxID=688607 RepID=UPI0027D35031|nr:syntaxin-1A-like [Achroia grisella]
MTKGRSDEETGDESGVVNVLKGTFMDAFFGEVEEIGEIIKKIQGILEKFNKKYMAILLSSSIQKNNIQELEDFRAKFLKNANEIISKLKHMKLNIEQEYSNKLLAEVRIRIQQYCLLIRNFKEVMREYSRMQLDLMDRFEDMLQFQLEKVGRAVTEELEEMFNGYKSDPSTKKLCSNMLYDMMMLVLSVDEMPIKCVPVTQWDQSFQKIHLKQLAPYLLVEARGYTRAPPGTWLWGGASLKACTPAPVGGRLGTELGSSRRLRLVLRRIIGAKGSYSRSLSAASFCEITSSQKVSTASHDP